MKKIVHNSKTDLVITLTTIHSTTVRAYTISDQNKFELIIFECLSRRNNSSVGELGFPPLVLTEKVFFVSIFKKRTVDCSIKLFAIKKFIYYKNSVKTNIKTCQKADFYTWVVLQK